MTAHTHKHSPSHTVTKHPYCFAFSPCQQHDLETSICIPLGCSGSVSAAPGRQECKVDGKTGHPHQVGEGGLGSEIASVTPIAKGRILSDAGVQLQRMSGRQLLFASSDRSALHQGVSERLSNWLLLQPLLALARRRSRSVLMA